MARPTTRLLFPLKLAGIVRNEFRKRGHDTHFLMWISFLAAFTTGRVWVLTVGRSAPDITATYSVGARVIVAGYHIHHIGVGVILIVVAGFLTLHYAGRRLNRLSAILYGVGLGFIVDEIGFIVGGIEPYNGDYEVFFLFVVISSLFMLGIYWPQFYRNLEWPFRMMARARRRRQRTRERKRAVRASRPRPTGGRPGTPQPVHDLEDP